MLARLPASMPRLVEDCVVWVHRRRTPVVAAACGLALIAAAIALYASNTAAVPLFDAPLHASQTAEIAQTLTLWNEPFTTGGKGDAVLVPAHRKREILMRLTLAGLPHGYVPTSADVLDAQDNPLTPPEIINDRRRAGIEGDLVSSLRRIDGVSDAAVVIAPATGDSFADSSERSPPSASVQLILAAGARLGASEVAGIRRFVAAGYPGLTADRVTVVDGTGTLLGAIPDQVSSRESRVQANVQSALDASLGAGVAIVRVSVRTAGSEQSVQSTRVVPHGLLDADLGRETGNEQGRKLAKERTTRHYAYDTIVERRTTAADAIARISVAVFLDAARVDQTRAPAIAALVRASAGADLESGDDVVVDAVPFAPRTSAVIATGPASIAPSVLPAAAVAMVAAALGFTLWPQRRRTAVDPAVARMRTALERESPRTVAYVLSTLPEAIRARVLASYNPPCRARIEEHLYREQQRRV
ncbi:MAG TPA: flagellar M-ring protein FliF C-terminal domain-containing protein [Candidatus Binatus sp.]|nr:flagellar M-ring protein FliF C-terminal domain-containing protein [Candidatus Binatus sp.]